MHYRLIYCKNVHIHCGVLVWKSVGNTVWRARIFRKFEIKFNVNFILLIDCQYFCSLIDVILA